MSNENVVTHGVHHVGLTVRNLGKTRSFFVETLGFEQVGEIPDYPAVFLQDTSLLLTLWQVENPASCTVFDRKNVVGLHHLALLVENHDALNSLYRTLRNLDDVDIEFAPESLAGSEVRHMMTSVPGGIRVEFLSPSA